MTSTTEGTPTPQAVLAVQGQKWVVSQVESAGDQDTLVSLQSVEHGRFGENLTVIWELESGYRVRPSVALPSVSATAGFDPPERHAAFLHTMCWSAVISADMRPLQAPFRSGVTVGDYQVKPAACAVASPCVNVPLADDVGLGKTIEAGLAAQELLLRHRVKRVMIVCRAALAMKRRATCLSDSS